MNNKTISNLPNQGNFLLEEWPVDSDRTRSLLEEWPHVDHPSIKKRVTFSEYSEVKILRNHSYPAKKSYSNDDYDLFKRRNSVEASRIEKLISQFNMSTGRAIHSALGYGLIEHENLVGLEHLVTSAAKEEYVYVRKFHSAMVLRAQKLLREKRQDSNELAAKMLAKAARMSSTRCVRKAILRAEMSLKAPEDSNQDKGVIDKKVSLNGFGSSSMTSKSNVVKETTKEKLVHFKIAREAKSNRVKATPAA